MKKTLINIYLFVAIFVVPIVAGGGVASSFLRVYDTYSHHWIAGVAILFFSGAIASWLPMLFLIENVPLVEKAEIGSAALVGWAGGILAPLIFGFNNLELILAVLLILTTFITMSTLVKALSQASRRIDEFKERDRPK